MVIALALALALGMPSSDYTPRKVGGWVVGRSGDSCLMTLDYEGPGETTVAVILDADGSTSILVENQNWSIKQDEILDLDFYLTAGAYTKHHSIGIKPSDDGKKGFVAWFEPKILDYVAASTFLRIERDGKTVDDLTLSGSKLAVPEIRRCMALVKAEQAADAREKARWSHIPEDPFANTSAGDKKDDRQPK